MTRKEMIAAVDLELVRLDDIRALLVKSHSERFTFSEAAPSAAADPPSPLPRPIARRSMTQAENRASVKQKRVPSADVN